eukprot:g7313.t2
MRCDSSVGILHDRHDLRAIHGGEPSLHAIQVLCDCIAQGALLGASALPPLQRFYAWLCYEVSNDVQEPASWLAQTAGHEAFVTALASPCRQVALWSCYCITLASTQHQRNAKGFAKAGADHALRGFAGRYVQDGEVAAAVQQQQFKFPSQLEGLSAEEIKARKARALDIWESLKPDVEAEMERYQTFRVDKFEEFMRADSRGVALFELYKPGTPEYAELFEDCNGLGQVVGVILVVGIIAAYFGTDIIQGMTSPFSGFAEQFVELYGF